MVKLHTGFILNTSSVILQKSFIRNPLFSTVQSNYFVRLFAKAKMALPRVFFDMAADDHYLGKIVIEVRISCPT